MFGGLPENRPRAPPPSFLSAFSIQNSENLTDCILDSYFLDLAPCAFDFPNSQVLGRLLQNKSRTPSSSFSLILLQNSENLTDLHVANISIGPWGCVRVGC